MKLFTSRLVKRILWVLVIIWCSGIFLNGHVGVSEPVHAQWTINTWASGSVTQPTDSMSIWQILNIFLKVIYLLLRPLLVIAGLALDNTLVYASVFHLDAPLRQFRNMMKNFANFALWFMVLYAIIKSIFSNSWEWSFKDEKSPLGIIKVTLIAGILVQASWFLLAALVDISTIATYAIGGLPLNVIKGSDIDKTRILSVNSSIDLNKFNLSFAWGEDFKVWYSVSHTWIKLPDNVVKISPCRIANSYVIGREFWDPEFNNEKKLNAMDEQQFKNMELCVLYGNQLVVWPEQSFFDDVVKHRSWCETTWCLRDTKRWYDNAMSKLLSMTWRITSGAITGKLVNLDAGTWVLKAWIAFFSGSNAPSLSSIIQQSKWFVWPLVTMYSSLLNFTQLTTVSVTSVSWASGMFIIKALVAIALFFPLIALALVLILRIGVLWLYIVASPFIILKESFKLKLWGLDTYLSVKSVIGIIFAPVVTVAALSLSLIFMTALVNGFSSNNSKESIHEAFDIQTITGDVGNDAVSFGWITQLEFTRLPWWEGMDWFSRLMVNCFAIGLMWMIFFAALKSNELWKAVWGKVEDIGTNVFKTLPILPIGPEGRWVGIGSAANVIKSVPDTYISNLSDKQERWLTNRLNSWDNTWWNENKWAATTFSAAPIVAWLWWLSTPTNKQEAEKIFTDNGVTTPPIQNITDNSQAYFAAIKALPDGQQKSWAISAIETVTWNSNWYEDMVKTEAKTNLETVTKLAADGPALETIFTNPSSENRTKIEAYFTATGWAPYEVPYKDGKIYTVTKITTTTPPTYTVVLKTP